MKRIRIWALMAVLMLVAAACGTSDTTTTQGETTATTTGETTATTTGETTETTMGELTVPDNPDNGVTADTIKLGWMGDATGPTASAQAFNLRGTQAFVEWQNQKGGLLGRQLELVVKDDEFNAEKALGNFTSLVEDERVIAIVQMGGSHISTALMPDVADFGIPVIGQGQTIDVQLDNPYVFSNMAHYGDEADVAIQRIASALGDVADARVVVAQLELPSGDEWNAYIETTLAEQGGTYLGRILINAGAPDYVASITELRDFVETQDANFVAIHAAPAHGLGFLTEMKNQGLRVPIIGIHGLAGKSIFTEGPADMIDLVEGVHSFIPSNVDSPGTQIIREFVAGTDWEEDSTQLNFSHGWLDGMIFVQAAERAAQQSGELTRDTLWRALQGPFDTMGISCPIDWSEFNHSPCAAPFRWNAETEGLEPVEPFDFWSLDGIYGLFEG
jgi:branched-chain amino acid transport system substrate-binding protein